VTGLIRRVRRDERGLSSLEWLGVVLAVFVLLSLVPQFRSGLDWFYEHLVGKNNVDAAGNPAPGVLIRGIIIGVASIVVFAGAVFLINYTNLGRKLAFLVTGAAFFGVLAIVGLLYTLYAPRGLRPALIEGLNSFQLRILPGALMIGSLILFAMFVAAMSHMERSDQSE